MKVALSVFVARFTVDLHASHALLLAIIHGHNTWCLVEKRENVIHIYYPGRGNGYGLGCLFMCASILWVHCG